MTSQRTSWSEADGSITLAGSVEPETGGLRFALARYLEDGALDSSFGNKGKVTTKFPGWTLRYR